MTRHPWHSANSRANGWTLASVTQERRGRCGGHLRGPATTRHAIRTDEVRGTAVAVDGEPCATRLRGRAHRDERILGLLAEFGIGLPDKAEVVRREAAQHLEGRPIGIGTTEESRIDTS